jgi:hypothetical protein
MKSLLLFCFSASSLFILGFTQINPAPTSPLSTFSDEWNNNRFQKCYTATDAKYLTQREKDVIHILNLLRTDPKLFANTVLKKYPIHSGNPHLKNIREFNSLLDTLLKMSSLNSFVPEQKLFISAECHAITSGEKNYVGHSRQSSDCRNKQLFYGECCDYGHEEPLDIVMSLLIDEGVASLGHRWICLGNYSQIGVAIRPHKGYGHNAVLDFY